MYIGWNPLISQHCPFISLCDHTTYKVVINLVKTKWKSKQMPMNHVTNNVEQEQFGILAESSNRFHQIMELPPAHHVTTRDWTWILDSNLIVTGMLLNCDQKGMSLIYCTHLLHLIHNVNYRPTNDYVSLLLAKQGELHGFWLANFLNIYGINLNWKFLRLSPFHNIQNELCLFQSMFK